MSGVPPSDRTLLFLGLIISYMTKSYSIKIGLLCDTDPSSWQYLFGIGSAINIAYDRLIKEGHIQEDTIKGYVSNLLFTAF